jgi:glucose-6-phosphate isomerase
MTITITNNFHDNISQATLDSLKLRSDLTTLKETLPLFKMVRTDQDIAVLEEVAQNFKRFKNVIVLGTGGSSLGGRALCDLADTSEPTLHFYDNIDPHTFKRLFKKIDLKTTGVIVISKSGSTAETLMQKMVCLQQWAAQSLPIKDHFLVITEPTENAMRTLAQSYDIQILDHPTDIGGRFAVFTLVGLLPAMIAGLNVYQFRAGALDCLRSLDSSLMEHPALQGALHQQALLSQGKTISVLMPYIDRLNTFALWYRQLWAESLGKNGKGTTPIAALGTVDQHSQLQLFLDGPKDKFFTIVTTNHVDPEFTITTPLDHSNISLFDQKTMGQLMVAEQQATIDTLKNNGCPLRHIHLDEVTEYTVGYMMMHYVLETLAMSSLLTVNAFDQPAVEEGKILTRQYLKAA